jgi:multidrug resistance efflux pump
MRLSILHTLPLLSLLACGGKPETSPAPVAPVTAPALVVGVANIEPLARTLDLTSEAAGVVDRILVEANDTVQQGDTLVVLRNAPERARSEQKAAALATQRNAVDAATQEIASAKADLDLASAELQRTEALFSGAAATAQERDQKRADAQRKAAQLRTLEARQREASSKVRELEADLRASRADLGRTLVLAPTAGLVLSIDTRVGSAAASNSTLGTFAPSGPLMAVTEVDELFADQVKLGDKAFIRPQGRMDTLSTGTVVFAAPSLSSKSLFSGQATDLEDRRVREVRVQLDRSDVLIGSRVDCVIMLSAKTR